LENDRPEGLDYEDGKIHPSPASLWG
jgi:hypothetical protein